MGKKKDKDSIRLANSQRNQGCLEVFNYYRWSIEDFASIARVLYDLEKKGQK